MTDAWPLEPMFAHQSVRGLYSQIMITRSGFRIRVEGTKNTVGLEEFLDGIEQSTRKIAPKTTSANPGARLKACPIITLRPSMD
jgi:hypothetical protein